MRSLLSATELPEWIKSILSHLGWSQRVQVAALLCRSYRDSLHLHQSYWEWCCKTIAHESLLYVPARCPGDNWKAVFLDVLWPARTLWDDIVGEEVEEAKAADRFSISVAAR